MSILSDTLNFRIKFCHSTGIARSGGGSGLTQQAMLSEGSDPKAAQSNIRTKLKKNIYSFATLTSYLRAVGASGLRGNGAVGCERLVRGLPAAPSRRLGPALGRARMPCCWCCCSPTSLALPSRGAVAR